MKAVVRYSGLLMVLAVVVLLGLADVTPAGAQDACEPTTWDLIAGQTTDVGSVTVSNDQENIYVRYTLDTPGACFGTLHLWVGTELANVPTNSQGIPVPGQFPYAFDASGLTTHTFTIPFSDLAVVCGDPVFVVPHAEVDLDCNSATGESETAFGGDQPGSGPRWWFYGEYEICCEEPPPPPPGECQEETAWGGSTPGGGWSPGPGAGGAWWYYYDNAQADTQPIFAGQNLTDGTVTCNETTGDLSIALGSWSLQNVEEPVKVQCYQAGTLPTERPAAGQFTTYKGTELTVPNFDCRTCPYIAIHLDVERCEE
jgi:hypothetical protein